MKLYTLTGPSGSGKTTAGDYLKELGLLELVSHTTRAKREGEIDGISYHFISKEEFSQIEKIEESNYAGNFYCLAKEEVENKLKQGKDVFAIVDLHGLRQIEERLGKNIELISIYFKLDEEVLKERLIQRGGSKEEIQKRIDKLREDLNVEKEYEFDYILDNSGNIDSIKDKMIEIIAEVKGNLVTFSHERFKDSILKISLPLLRAY